MPDSTGTPRLPVRNGRNPKSRRPSESGSPQEAIKRRIAELVLEHRGLDTMIEALGRERRFDELQLRRLKKRKLQVKDAIVVLQMQLVPDIKA